MRGVEVGQPLWRRAAFTPFKKDPKANQILTRVHPGASVAAVWWPLCRDVIASVIGCPERVELLDAGRLLSILEGLLEYDYSDEQGFDDGHSAARGV